MKKMDFHVHLSSGMSADEGAVYLNDMIERKGYSGLGIMCCGTSTAGVHKETNEIGMEIIKKLPESYAFAGIFHDRDLVEQTKEYMAQGFKGIKLLEGKPSIYRYYGYGFEHPMFEPFFDYAEKNQIPLLIHNNDPENHWDITRMTETSIAKGWYYDEKMPSQEHFFKVFEDVLDRHPNLRIGLAHFGFYSNDLDKAEELMEKCPNLMMDMTPALVIYDELSRTPERTRAFLVKYQDRILFGTDATSNLTGRNRTLNDSKTEIMDFFFEKTGELTHGHHSVVGMGLDESILEKLYYKNAMRFMKLS